jgi:DNA-binding CsgD family transcriptional regulator
MRGMAAEGALWLNRILAIEGGSTFRRANALNSLGYLHELLGNTEQAERALQQALALLDDSAYSSPRGRACFFLALVAWRNGPAYIHDAHRFLIDALESFARWNDALGQGLSKLALGEFARRAGQLPESLHCFADAYALHHAVGYEWGMATARWFTGEAHRAAGDEREAAAAFADALQVYSGFGDRLGASGCLGGIACLLTGRREWTAAGRLFGAAAARKERTQSFLLPTHEAEYGAIAQTVILAGGTAAFAAGQHLSQEQAIAEALGLANAIATGQPIDVDRGGTKKGLTRTQKQVLVHFGEGHEPKTIAGMLGKSPKTIYDHLKHLRVHFDCASYDELRQRARHLGLRNEAIDPLSHP